MMAEILLSISRISGPVKKKRKKLETLYSDKQAKDFAVIVQSYSQFNSFGRWIVIITLHISGRINTFKPCIILTQVKKFRTHWMNDQDIIFPHHNQEYQLREVFWTPNRTKTRQQFKYGRVISLQLCLSISKMTSYTT